ncbi:NAD-dependent epimerase/dehydratase family protein [Halobacillus locisalis]|uniref:UDP-glucose 4-epimerase n=1 Tax=Halobacillus locisalis TaxID=220753 RepID=A0A838CRH7_9BACI|nr:NAD-dependent epimerase/dehydratase family protein [Halobacillus locisalis]MBA2174226.1 NAD-dependent epimerase/dehydratase family protein [Halobacillus locisalis]
MESSKEGEDFMKVLVIGGTQFLGRYIVEAALAKGHELTLFNRGKTNPELHDGVEAIRGDREKDEDLAQLKSRHWDVVIDTCGFTPRRMEKGLSVLAEKVEHYIFISSASVYKDLLEEEGLTEEAETLKLTQEEIKDVTAGATGRIPGYYGHLKYHSEQSVLEWMKDCNTIIRPGLIVGPHDPTDRFTYWPSRIARGGDVLAPGYRNKTVQVIDVRDLANWTISLAEERTVGTFNAAGPGRRLTMESFLETCRTAFDSNVSFVWASNEFLEENVKPWIEMPLWIPKERGFGIDSTEAFKQGLHYRPIEETIRDTYTWDQTRESSERQAGLDSEKERKLLERVLNM